MSLLSLFRPPMAYYERDSVLHMRPWVILGTGNPPGTLSPRGRPILQMVAGRVPTLLPPIPTFLRLRSVEEWRCGL